MTCRTDNDRCLCLSCTDPCHHCGVLLYTEDMKWCEYCTEYIEWSIYFCVGCWETHNQTHKEPRRPTPAPRPLAPRREDVPPTGEDFPDPA